MHRWMYACVHACVYKIHCWDTVHWSRIYFSLSLYLATSSRICGCRFTNSIHILIAPPKKDRNVFPGPHGWSFHHNFPVSNFSILHWFPEVCFTGSTASGSQPYHSNLRLQREAVSRDCRTNGAKPGRFLGLHPRLWPPKCEVLRSLENWDPQIIWPSFWCILHMCL